MPARAQPAARGGGTHVARALPAARVRCEAAVALVRDPALHLDASAGISFTAARSATGSGAPMLIDDEIDALLLFFVPVLRHGRRGHGVAVLAVKEQGGYRGRLHRGEGQQSVRPGQSANRQKGEGKGEAGGARERTSRGAVARSRTWHSMASFISERRCGLTAR